jgi:hypothetical protein
MKTSNLSDNAHKLYIFLLKTGGAWKQNCIEALFGKVEYPINGTKEDYLEYWQWSANLYGCDENRRSVLGEIIDIKATADYSNETSKAYQELRKAGLANEKNNGSNEYFFYPVNN